MPQISLNWMFRFFIIWVHMIAVRTYQSNHIKQSGWWVCTGGPIPPATTAACKLPGCCCPGSYTVQSTLPHGFCSNRSTGNNRRPCMDRIPCSPVDNRRDEIFVLLLRQEDLQNRSAESPTESRSDWSVIINTTKEYREQPSGRVWSFFAVLFLFHLLWSSN